MRLSATLPIAALAAGTAMALGLGAAQADGTVRIGLIVNYSGQFADTGIQIDNGVKLYMKQHGDTVAGKKIEIIRKDNGGMNPATAKRLSQEVIVRDKADILAGFDLSPNGFAGADISKQAKKFMVIMNAATSAVIDHSPYAVRTSMTIAQPTYSLGVWAAKHGIKRAYTMVADYAPGKDSEQAFSAGFKANGGQIIGSVRMAVENPDFSAYVQRAKDLNPEAIFVWVPGGTQPASLAKAIIERGIDPQKVKILATGEPVDEKPLASMGDSALGIISGWHYDTNHQSATNKEFVKAFNDEFHRSPDFFAVGGYDGMHLIYEALKKTNGDTDADKLTAAAKGMTWESPRGPMKIDAKTGDVVQTIYIRRVEKVGGKLVNVEFDKIENVADPVKAGLLK